MKEPQNRELARPDAQLLLRRSSPLLGCLFVISSVGVLMAFMSRQQLRSVSQLMRSHDEAPHILAPSDRHDDATGAGVMSLWDKLMDHLPEDMKSIGMTKRQAQVGMGVIQQKTYQEIANEVRLTERTVRLHATSAFQKVGCTKRSEFLGALMAAIQESHEPAEESPRSS